MSDARPSLAKLPWMKLRWEFVRGTTFHGCSLAAQGLYLNLMSMMRECDRYGYLSIAGKAPKKAVLERMVGARMEDILPAMDELKAQGLLVKDENGVIYSPQMVAEEAAYVAAATNGKRGGNPDLVEKPRRQRAKDKARVPRAVRRRAEREKTHAETLENSAKEGAVTVPNPLIVQGVTDGLGGGLRLDRDLDRESEKKDSRGSASQIPVAQADACATGEGNVVAHPASSRVSEQILEAAQMWNTLATANELPLYRTLNPDRRRRLGLRLKEAGGLEGWAHALRQVQASDFLCGRTPKCFRADLEFMLQPKSFERVMNGFYLHTDKQRGDSKLHYLTEMMAAEANLSRNFA